MMVLEKNSGECQHYYSSLSEHEFTNSFSSYPLVVDTFHSKSHVKLIVGLEEKSGHHQSPFNPLGTMKLCINISFPFMKVERFHKLNKKIVLLVMFYENSQGHKSH